MADARDSQPEAGAAEGGCTAGSIGAVLKRLSRGRPRQVSLALAALVVAGGLAVTVTVRAAGSMPVRYRVAARFADPGFQVGAMAMTPESRILYVIGTASANDDSAAYAAGPFPPQVVVPVSVATGVAGRPIPVGRQPVALAVTPDGRILYVVNYRSGTVTPISTATGMPGRPIPVGTGPDALAITPDSKTLYVATNRGVVVPVSIAAGRPGTPITVGGSLSALAVAPGGRMLYVASGSASGARGSIVPVSTATGAAGTAIPLPRSPDHLAITPDGRTLYVGSELNGGVSPDGGGTVTPVSTVTGHPGTPIVIGSTQTLTAMAVAPGGATLYVASMDGATSQPGIVTPVSTATGSLGTPVVVGAEPYAIAIDPDGTSLYAAAFIGSGTQVSTLTRVKLAR